MSTLLTPKTQVLCYHCGNECKDEDILSDDKHFCCSGCLTVYDILKDNQLCGYYDLNQNAGVSLKAKILTENSIICLRVQLNLNC